MKKLLALAIGLGIVLGTVSFAQDTSDTTKTGKKKLLLSLTANI